MEHYKFIVDKTVYLKNCVYWIQEHTERDEPEALLKTVEVMQKHCREIIEKIKIKKQ